MANERELRHAPGSRTTGARSTAVRRKPRLRPPAGHRDRRLSRASTGTSSPRSTSQGAVIDERYNHGGSSPTTSSSPEAQPLRAGSRRATARTCSPPPALYGPKTMIVNRLAGSGGDALPWMFRSWRSARWWEPHLGRTGRHLRLSAADRRRRGHRATRRALHSRRRLGGGESRRRARRRGRDHAADFAAGRDPQLGTGSSSCSRNWRAAPARSRSGRRSPTTRSAPGNRRPAPESGPVPLARRAGDAGRRRSAPARARGGSGARATRFRGRQFHRHLPPDRASTIRAAAGARRSRGVGRNRRGRRRRRPRGSATASPSATPPEATPTRSLLPTTGVAAARRDAARDRRRTAAPGDDRRLPGAHHRPGRPGDQVLVHAAAGGVGLLAVQLARLAGATVYGTCSTPGKAAAARAAGCDRRDPLQRGRLRRGACSRRATAAASTWCSTPSARRPFATRCAPRARAARCRLRPVERSDRAVLAPRAPRQSDAGLGVAVRLRA